MRRKVHIAFDISCICSAIVHNLEGVWKNLVCLRACMCTYTVFSVTTCTRSLIVLYSVHVRVVFPH